MARIVDKFQLKRGLKANLPKLSPAEMAFTTDEKRAYIGDGNENIRLLDQKDKSEIDNKQTYLTTQLAEKANKDAIFTMSNMGQDIKEAMTGGSVPVVGVNAVQNVNIGNKQVSKEKTDFISPTNKNLVNINVYEEIPGVVGYPAKITVENSQMKIVSNETVAVTVLFKLEDLIVGEVYTFVFEQENTAYIRLVKSDKTTVIQNWTVSPRAYQNITPTESTIYIRCYIEKNKTATIPYLAFFKGAYETLPKTGVNYRIAEQWEVESSILPKSTLNKIEQATTNIQAIEENIKEKAAFILPPIIPCVVGKTMNVLLNNLVQNKEYRNIGYLNLTGGTYSSTNEGVWIYKPTDANEKQTSLLYYRKDDIQTPYATAATTEVIPVKANVGTGVTRNVLYIGDSRTEQGMAKGELTTLFASDPMKINLLGTRGTTPNRHEGRSGWWAQLYCESATNNGVTNPFYNNGFDFTYYMTTQGYDSVDIVVIQLSKNDINKYGVSSFITYINQMITSILSFNTNIKIMITLTELFSDMNTTGNKNRTLAYIKGIIDTYKTNKSIFLTCEYLNVNTKSDFTSTDIIINPRNTNETFKYVADITHPLGAHGYGKIADCHYYMIKYIESLRG